MQEDDLQQCWDLRFSEATFRNEQSPHEGTFNVRFELGRTHRIIFLDPMDGSTIGVRGYLQPCQAHEFQLSLPISEGQQQLRTILREFLVIFEVHPDFHLGIIERIISYGLRMMALQQQGDSRGMEVHIIPHLEITTTRFVVPVDLDWDDESNDYDFDEPVSLEPLSRLAKLHSFVVGKDTDVWEVRECNICRENLAIDGGFTVLSKLSCSHVFHDSCILRWLQERNCCPFC